MLVNSHGEPLCGCHFLREEELDLGDMKSLALAFYPLPSADKEVSVTSHTLAANSLLVRGKPKAGWDVIMPAYGCLAEPCLLSQGSRSMKMPRKAQGRCKDSVRSLSGSTFEKYVCNPSSAPAGWLKRWTELVLRGCNPSWAHLQHAGRRGRASIPHHPKGCQLRKLSLQMVPSDRHKAEGAWGREPKQGSRKQEEETDRK